MNLKNKNQKGFTLIELLVVISIISLLSSVVLSSLKDARIKAKDTAIKAQLNQMATLMNLEFNENGSYLNLVPNAWITSVSMCDTAFSGNYATKASEICKAVYRNNNTMTLTGYVDYRYLVYVSPSSRTNTFSISAALNNGKWYCVGSSNLKTESTYNSSQPGCYANP